MLVDADILMLPGLGVSSSWSQSVTTNGTLNACTSIPYKIGIRSEPEMQLLSISY